jgi:hypothetical protein
MKIVQCVKHQKIKFTIPENVDECITLNLFQEIKSLENHLDNYPNCKMMERRDSK